MKQLHHYSSNQVNELMEFCQNMECPLDIVPAEHPGSIYSTQLDFL
jgi:hypothetical protein